MRHHDLIVLGAGSGNNIISDDFRDLDIGIIEHGLFGGTCLNRGCIPTKMFAFTADVAELIRRSDTYDLDATLGPVRWPDIRDRVFGRLDPLAESGRDSRVRDWPNVTVYSGEARFSGPRTLQVEGYGGLSADRVVIAAGGRPMVPEPIASAGVPFETSDSIMHIDELPGHLVILGGGYIAAEFAHVFAQLGSRITMIDMADQLFGGQDETIVEAFTELVDKRYDVLLGRQVAEIAGEPGAVRLTLDDETVVEADMLLVAVGRVPNGDRLDLAAAGIETHDDGRIAVDARQRTTAAGVYALGDVSSPVQLKHVANRQADVVAHNLLHPDEEIETDREFVPSAIFTGPQIAAVGRTEQQCREQGLDYVVGVRSYSEVAYGWAMEDTTGFCKVLAERGTGRLLGAHLMGPQAATLIQPIVLAMACGIDATTLARRPYWIHPALTEVVQNALLALEPR